MMHDMVRDMGREIVRQESREDPGKRSRLWYPEDALEVLRYGTGTDAVKGLLLNTTDIQVNAMPFEKMDKLWYHESVLKVQRESMGTEAVEGRLLNLKDPKDVQVNAKGFNKMYDLWLLHLDYVHLSTDFEHISRRLLWLSWKGFPLECLPWNLSMEKLIALDLRYSSLKKVWNGYKNLGNLKFLYLSHCHYLTKTPDFSGLNSLEELLLDDCKSLVEVDESIRCLDKLFVLDLKCCTKLRKLPSGIWMLKSLECLDLSGCSKLGNLAVFKGPLHKLWCLFFSSWTLPPKGVNSFAFSLTSVQPSGCLKELKLAYSSLSYLPDEIGNLISLQTLDLCGNNLITLPDRICNLTCLKDLNLECNNVSHLPSEIDNLVSLQTLDLYENNLSTLPDRIWNLTCLKDLDLGRNNVSHLPSEIGNLVSLEELRLQVTTICTLPDSISNLHCLAGLFLIGCEKLQSLPKLPRKCQVDAQYCTSLESMPLELDQLGWKMFCAGSNKLAENDFANRLLKQLYSGKGLAELEEFMDIMVPTVGDIPSRLPYQGKGSYISFVVPPLVKQKMLGWVICISFAGGYTSWVFVDKVVCNKIKKERVYAHDERPFSDPKCQGQVWLRYTPQGYSGLHLKDGDEVELSIWVPWPVLVKNWGVDFIYEVE